MYFHHVIKYVLQLIVHLWCSLLVTMLKTLQMQWNWLLRMFWVTYQVIDT